MAIVVESRRKKLETVLTHYPDALIIDVTSRGAVPWVRFSPFYPHGGIPVPLSQGHTATSVEGIWQGLKVFQFADVDVSKFAVTSMKGLKRTARSFGSVLGHRAGIGGNRLLSYREARFLIYLPAYKWVLDNCLQSEIQRLIEESRKHRIVLLDYEINADVENLTKPLSHAALLVSYILGEWPTERGERK